MGRSGTAIVVGAPGAAVAGCGALAIGAMAAAVGGGSDFGFVRLGAALRAAIAVDDVKGGVTVGRSKDGEGAVPTESSLFETLVDGASVVVVPPGGVGGEGPSTAHSGQRERLDRSNVIT